MEDELLISRIIICSPNGKFRFVIYITDQGDLVANPLDRDTSDPNKWHISRTGKLLCPQRP